MPKLRRSNVHLNQPDWWYENQRLLNRFITLLLQPAGAAYNLAHRLRTQLHTPYDSKLPVVCVGNFTIGGGGKTPTAIHIAKLYKQMGLKPGFLTRGYGGREAGPHLVDAQRDDAERVGDEPLLLARHAPTLVSRSREKGAQYLENLEADVIIMDDGFQNPTLKKDLCVIAIDNQSGLGNEKVFPAGPLRASLSWQAPRADLILMIGAGEPHRCLESVKSKGFTGNVLEATTTPVETPDWLRDKSIVAFTGIARPQKFMDTLSQQGAQIGAFYAFPDHYRFRTDDARSLLAAAESSSATLVTTEKDWLRIPKGPDIFGELKTRSKPMVISLQLAPDGESQLVEQLQSVI